MTRAAAALLVLMLAGCSDPWIGAGIGVGPNGVSVNPVVSGRVGGARISVSP